MKAALQDKPKASSNAPPIFTPVRSGLLQRTCACRGTPGPPSVFEETAIIHDEFPASALRRIGHTFLKTSVRADAPAPIQPKLKVSSLGDAHEQEAERVQKQVMQMPEPQPQRTSAPLKGRKREEQGVQGGSLASTIRPFSRAKGGTDSIVSDAFSNRIVATRGTGSGLPQEDRIFMEERFGTDFSAIRVHTDDNAVELSRQVGAHAFATGNDVYFSSNAFSPGSTTGRQLLAHELTHVIQQGKGVGQNIHRSPSFTIQCKPGNGDDPKSLRFSKVQSSEADATLVAGNKATHAELNAINATAPSFDDVYQNAIAKIAGQIGYTLTSNIYFGSNGPLLGGDGEIVGGTICIDGPGIHMLLTYDKGAWSYDATFAKTAELPGGHLQGIGLPLGFLPQKKQSTDAVTEDDTSALETGVDIATDFVPFVGSGKDIYKGIRDGDGWIIALGVGGFVLDVVTFGGASIVKGGVKTLFKQGSKALLERGAKEVLENGGKELIREGGEEFIEQGGKEILDRGITVLGNHPDYQELAHQLDAAYFQVHPAKWDAMTKAEQKAANLEFLEIQAEWGSEFRLSNSAEKHLSGRSFPMEIKFMTSKKMGYKLGPNGMSLIKK